MTFNMIIAVIMIIAIVICLFKEVSNPGVVFASISIIAALLMGHSFREINGWIWDGFGWVGGTVFLMVFAVLYFGILHEANIFKLIVRVIMRLVGNNVTAVLIVTDLLSIATQMDGSGATTALCTIPPLKPIYEKMNIRREALMLIFTFGGGCMLLLPWAPGINEYMTYVGSDAYTAFSMLIPVLIFVLVLSVIACIIYAIVEKKHGAGMSKEAFEQMKIEIDESTKVDTSKKGIMIFDGVLTIAMVVSLLAGWTSANVVFALGLGILLLVNYKNADAQYDYIARQARTVANMTITMFGLAVFLGVCDGTGALNELTEYITAGVPESIIIHLPFIICMLALPLSVFLGSASAAILVPSVATLAAPLGIDPAAFMAVYFVSQISSINLCLFSATPYLALELADVKLIPHLKYSLAPCLIFGWLTTIFCAVIGLIPF